MDNISELKSQHTASLCIRDNHIYLLLTNVSKLLVSWLDFWTELEGCVDGAKAYVQNLMAQLNKIRLILRIFDLFPWISILIQSL